MATTEAERMRRLAVVRRLEAAGFRAWPANSTRFDGTWAVRLTPSFPAKRLNSVNPLDPSDSQRIPERLEQARLQFEAAGRPLVVRLSPLAPTALAAYLDEQGWESFAESVVMTAELSAMDLTDAIDRIPLKDVERYVSASLEVHERPAELKEALTAIVEAIRPPTGLFLREDRAGEPLAVALLAHDNDVVGLLDVAVRRAERGAGIGRDIVRTTLRYGHHRGAQTAWVQVEADNAAGRALYAGLGFVEAYRYVYRAESVPA